MKIQLLEGHMNFEWLVAHLEHVSVGKYGPRGPLILKTLTGISNQSCQYQHLHFQKFFIFIERVGTIEKNVSFGVRRTRLWSEFDY